MAHGKWTPENFRNYHAQNPHIYERFCKFALEAVQRRHHFSAKAIFHIIRWYTPDTDDQDSFKIDDGWISHYARKFMDEHPEHDGYFETRERRGSYHERPPPRPAITEQQPLQL
jgi:hypothetical protein